jgi:hypothetical protein
VEYMASPGSLAGGLPREVRGVAWRAFLARGCAFLAGPRYDAELADGIGPTTSIYHAARAGRITTPRECRRVAGALRRAVAAAERPRPNWLDAKVPVDAGAVRVCRDRLLALADTLATVERPPARGVAIARQLVFDCGSPLFLQAPSRRKGADRRLASTLNAAQRALAVSADLDSLSASAPSTDERSTEMAVDTKMPVETEKTVDTNDDAPVVSDGTGERDLMLGMTVGAVMAFGALALGIIFSLT